MKKLLSILLFLTACNVSAQQIKKFSIDNGGESVSVSSTQVIYSIGEVNVQELSSGNNAISEGFINPEMTSALVISDAKIIDLILYPNPVSDNLNVAAKDTITKISIYNQLGQLVKSQNPLHSNFNIDVSNLSTGTYLIKIEANNKITTKQIIKK